MESEQEHPSRGLNKGSGSMFCIGSQGWRTYRPKHYEDNCPKTLNDKNHFSLFSIRKERKTF